MDYEEKILSRLIDSYERRNPEKKGPRKISLVVGKVFPEYQDTLSDAQREIEGAIQHLLAWRYVACGRNMQGYCDKITLLEDAVTNIYDFLQRTPKSELVDAQRRLLEGVAARAGGVTERFSSAMLARIALRKDLEYGLSKDTKLLKDVLLALENIEKLREETYIRNFSVMVFDDSKRMQGILGTVSKILLDYGEGACQKETVLAQYNLINNPGYVYIKGNWQLWRQGQCIPVDLFRGGIAISSDALDGIERIAVPGGIVISVENRTTFHDTKEDQGAIIYLGGFLNTVRANFLKKLYVFAPEAEYFHKGDLDPYGFLILENLKKKTGIPFRPKEMDLNTLRRCHHAGHFKPLEDADRTAIESPELVEYRPILHYMVENNCKVEQECFEAMELERRVAGNSTQDFAAVRM